MGAGMAASVLGALSSADVIGGRVIRASGTIAARRLGFVPTLSRLGLTNGQLQVALTVTHSPSQQGKSAGWKGRPGLLSGAGDVLQTLYPYGQPDLDPQGGCAGPSTNL